MMPLPETSVIMSVYNTERFVIQAIESILGQTYRDFEFVIVNDGSTDKTGQILSEFQKRDARIVLLNNQKNIGVTKSLNIALKEARGKYVARMDPDDISRKDRLEIQISYMKSNPLTDILGSYVKSIDEDGSITGEWIYPDDPVSIRWQLIFANALAHPSVVYKKDIVLSAGGYNEDLASGIDYDLWVRLSPKARICQVKEFLVMWRSHTGSITYQYAERRKNTQKAIVKKQIEGYLGREVPDKDVESLYSLEAEAPLSSPEAVKDAAALIEEIYKAFMKDNPGLSPIFSNSLIGSKLLKLALLNIYNAPGISAAIIFRSIGSYFSIKALFSRPLFLTFARATKRRLTGAYAS